VISVFLAARVLARSGEIGSDDIIVIRLHPA
jgi:hypothetical protein